MKQDEVRKQSLTYFVNYFYPVEDEMNFPNVLRSYTENVKGILIDTNTFDATFFPDGAVSYAISCEFSYITIEIFGVYKGTKILLATENDSYIFIIQYNITKKQITNLNYMTLIDDSENEINVNK